MEAFECQPALLEISTRSTRRSREGSLLEARIAYRATLSHERLLERGSSERRTMIGSGHLHGKDTFQGRRIHPQPLPLAYGSQDMESWILRIGSGTSSRLPNSCGYCFPKIECSEIVGKRYFASHTGRDLAVFPLWTVGQAR